MLFRSSTGISPSAALTVVFISSFFFLPMRRLGSLFHTGMNANAVCERIFALLDAEDQFATDEQVDLGGPGIECSNLSFSYDGKAKALDGVDFDVPAHTLIGVTLRFAASAFIICKRCTSLVPSFG